MERSYRYLLCQHSSEVKRHQMWAYPWFSHTWLNQSLQSAIPLQAWNDWWFVWTEAVTWGTVIFSRSPYIGPFTAKHPTVRKASSLPTATDWGCEVSTILLYVWKYLRLALGRAVASLHTFMQRGLTMCNVLVMVTYTFWWIGAASY